MADTRPTRGPVLDRAVAQRHSYASRVGIAPAPSMELDGLLRGLSVFNAELGRYTDQQIATYKTEGIASAQREATARSAASKATSAEEVQAEVNGELPANVPPAFGNVFREALGNSLVDRLALKARQEWSAAYEEARKDPDFDPEKFLAEQRQRSLGGLADPGLAGRMGQHLNEFEGAVRAAAEKERLKKIDEAAEAAVFTDMQGSFRADMAPQQWAEVFLGKRGEWEKLGKSKKELAQRLFMRALAVSEQKGGDPSVFEVFDAVDPDTKQPLLALNPDLQDNVLRAREAAKAKNMQLLREAAQSANLPARVELDRDLEERPETITLERVLRHHGPLGLFQTTDEMAAYLARGRANAAKKAAQTQLMGLYDQRMLGLLDPKEQREVLEAKLGGAVTAAWQQAVQGNGEAMAQLSAFILGEQSRVRATVPVPAIERLVQTVLTSAQDPNGATPEFQAIASLWRGLSADEKYRSLYFKDDVDELMREYWRAKDNGSDESAAYKAAYRAISPEAKAAAEKLAKEPAFAKKLKDISDKVTGVGFMQRWFGWGMEPANKLQVEMAAQAEAKAYLSRNPSAASDPDRVFSHVGSWVSRNFVLDRHNGVAVRVPAGSADETMQEAITEYTRRVSEAYALKDRNDGEWRVEFRSIGDGNLAHVVLTSGAAEQALGTVPLASIREAYRAEKVVTDADRAVYLEVQKQQRLGKFDLNYLDAHATSLAKAEKLRLLPRETLQAVEQARLTQIKETLAAVPKLAPPLPSLENLSTVPKRAVKVDNRLTAEVARSFIDGQSGGAYQQMTLDGKATHHGLAASLVTMGEAVVLKASPDPNPQAGLNIGMGYNLKANAKTVRDDLKRAGVSEDRIEAVIAGEAQLTPAQAQKLLMVAMPRYEKLAATAANETAPGLWDRMTPQQRAVMIDVAWQTGDPAQFRKAWRSLASGDAAKFMEETKVFYTNAKGERVEDKRRGELRAAMLNGTATWMAVVNKYGGFPANSVEALALNSK